MPELSDGQRAGPWWLTAIQKLGPVTVIALGLVWFLKHDVAEAQTKLQTTLELHVADMRSDQVRNSLLLYGVCLNTSKDDAAKAFCQSILTSETSRLALPPR